MTTGFGKPPCLRRRPSVSKLMPSISETPFRFRSLYSMIIFSLMQQTAAHSGDLQVIYIAAEP